METCFPFKGVRTLFNAFYSVQLSDAAPAYQHLEPRKGYVPVYIREGNTPLTEIHPGLAEAFHENEQPTTKQDAIE